jgi:acyl-coenzyme A thioesterase PaaI-like protein
MIAVPEPQENCVVCGRANAGGLRIEYRREADGCVTAIWRPTSAWEGFRGVVHGGIVSTVLDEAMSKAVVGIGRRALTGELRVRFRQPVAPGDDLRVRGWVVLRHRRLIRTEAALEAADGTERAHAWATFLPVGIDG